MTVRPARKEDVPAIAKVHVDTWRAAYRGIIVDSFLAALSYQKHEERHHHPFSHPDAIFLVAELPQSGVVGFLLGGKERTSDPQFTSEIYAIYILPKYQNQHIGSALFHQWAATLRQRGMNSALVWVLADNKPAIRFYERRGAKHLREQMLTIGEQSLEEIAFGWKDLGGLTE